MFLSRLNRFLSPGQMPASHCRHGRLLRCDGAWPRAGQACIYIHIYPVPAPPPGSEAGEDGVLASFHRRGLDGLSSRLPTQKPGLPPPAHFRALDGNTPDQRETTWPCCRCVDPHSVLGWDRTTGRGRRCHTRLPPGIRDLGGGKRRSGWHVAGFLFLFPFFFLPFFFLV